jgi:hypothetical protein
VEVTSISCNKCGAPLDVPPGANFATCGHCGSRLAIHRSGSAAYTEVLEQIDQRTAAMWEDMETIRLQNELEQIDREWLIERERYRISGRNGSTLPSGTTPVAIVAVGAIAFLFVLAWIVLASGMTLMTGCPIFPLFGVLFLILLIGAIGSALSKTNRYAGAERNYLQRREGILRRLNGDFAGEAPPAMRGRLSRVRRS